MTDHLDALADPSDDDVAALAALLTRAETWDDPPRDLEDAVVAAIVSEASELSRATQITPSERRARAVWSRSRMLGAAAAVAVVVVGIVLMTRDASDDVTFALVGTDAEPGASAEVVVSATPAGLKILLDTDGLPGAPDGFMYEAWVGDGTIGVSAGTFHLRGGAGPIELWAGVTDPEFHRLWITLEPIDDDATASADARLRGEFALPDD
jgi:hypothetical protein